MSGGERVLRYHSHRLERGTRYEGDRDVSPDVDRPNVVVIYTDDQGYGDVSSLNPDAKFETPTFDRLADEGMSFTDAHCR